MYDRKGSGAARSSTSRPGSPRTAGWTRASQQPPTGPDRRLLGGAARSGAEAVRRGRAARGPGSARRRAGTGCARFSRCTAPAWRGSARCSTRREPPGEEAKRKLLEDGVVASLLLIHDLYPVPLEERVARGARGGPSLHGIPRGRRRAARGRGRGGATCALKGSCDGCPASASTLELAIKEALEKAAPDLVGLEVEGVVDVDAAELPRRRAAGDPGRRQRLRGRRPAGGPMRRDGRRRAGAGARAVEGVEIVRRQRQRLAARLPRPCAGLRRADRRRRLKGGVLDCPSCERALSTCRAPAARWTRSGCCWNRCRCSSRAAR